MLTSEITSDFIYVVYDPDTMEKEPGRDLAFIEQRAEVTDSDLRDNGDEIHFTSLKEAKTFVRDNFALGAEYFSSKQLRHPDNLFYALADKLTYLMA